MCTQDLPATVLPAPMPVEGLRRMFFAATVSVVAHLGVWLVLYDWLPLRYRAVSSRSVQVDLQDAQIQTADQQPRIPVRSSPGPVIPPHAVDEPLPPAREGQARTASPVATKPAVLAATPSKPVVVRQASRPTRQPTTPEERQPLAAKAPLRPANVTASSSPADPQSAFTAPRPVGLSNPKPPYPLLARRRGLEGQVLLSVRVQADGRVADVEIKQGSGHAILDQAAVKTLYRWRFVPARRGGHPVSADVEVPILFRLKDTG